MSKESAELHKFWNTSIKQMPRKETQGMLKELGFSYSTSGLSDDELRKLLYGILLNLDIPSQIETIHALS